MIQPAPPASSTIILCKNTANYEAIRDFPQPPASPYLAYVLLAPNLSLKATVAQFKNCTFGVKTTIELININSTSDNNGI
jgi:hypothetical protein